MRQGGPSGLPQEVRRLLVQQDRWLECLHSRRGFPRNDEGIKGGNTERARAWVEDRLAAPRSSFHAPPREVSARPFGRVSFRKADNRTVEKNGACRGATRAYPLDPHADRRVGEVEAQGMEWNGGSVEMPGIRPCEIRMPAIGTVVERACRCRSMTTAAHRRFEETAPRDLLRPARSRPLPAADARSRLLSHHRRCGIGRIGEGGGFQVRPQRGVREFARGPCRTRGHDRSAVGGAHRHRGNGRRRAATGVGGVTSSFPAAAVARLRGRGASSRTPRLPPRAVRGRNPDPVQRFRPWPCSTPM